jgi:hypothetical protein
MAWTQTDLDAVEKAISAGELSIGLGDMRITYRSMRELLDARDTIRAELIADGVIAAKSRVSFASRVRD